MSSITPADPSNKYDIRNLGDEDYPKVTIGGERDLPATHEQITELFVKWKIDHNEMTWVEFAHSVVMFDFGAIGVQWCGMWVGIEKDGHAHT